MNDLDITLILGMSDSETHRTRLFFNPFLLAKGGVHSAWPSDFFTFTCETCGLPFRIAFLTGGPYFWDETAAHLEPKCFMEIAVQGQEREIMPWLQGIPWVREETVDPGH